MAIPNLCTQRDGLFYTCVYRQLQISEGETGCFSCSEEFGQSKTTRIFDWSLQTIRRIFLFPTTRGWLYVD
jgi:hypothetical protein